MSEATPTGTGVTDEASAVDTRLAFAREIARSAGDVTLRYFGTATLEVEQKGDGTPVSVADRTAETHLRDRIAEAFPHDAVLGEEHDDRPGTTGFRWILDPIDGTKSFVHGVPLYGTLVAVERGPHVLAGVIHMPALDEMVFGAVGRGAWHVVGGGEPAPARVSTVATLAESTVCTTSFEYFTGQGTGHVFMDLAPRVAATRGWSDCYAHVLAVTGRIDAVVEPLMSPWDIAATIPIVIEAGGRCTSWQGKTDAYATDAIVTNGLVHDELLEIVGRA
jgi:histidinol phosphatase-like enzyme (inositol monophosphatase family)